MAVVLYAMGVSNIKEICYIGSRTVQYVTLTPSVPNLIFSLQPFGGAILGSSIDLYLVLNARRDSVVQGSGVSVSPTENTCDYITGQQYYSSVQLIDTYCTVQYLYWAL